MDKRRYDMRLERFLDLLQPRCPSGVVWDPVATSYIITPGQVSITPLCSLARLESTTKLPPLTSMDKLPIEILIHVFLFYSPSKPQRNIRRSLSRVCHLWQTVIYGTPLFWTEVGLHRTTEELREILRCNPYGPLDVSWTPSNLGKIMDEAAKQGMAMISSESHCWRSFIFAGQITDQIQAQLINVPTPRLVNFNVVRDSVRVQEIHLATEGASLRELTLACCALDWESSRLRRLRCLRLHRQAEKAPSVKQLHAMLSASPGLEILDLAYWNHGYQYQLPDETLGTVLLPSLTTLAVEEVQPIVLRTLLYCVQSPNCKYIRLVSVDQMEFLDNYPLEGLMNLLQGPLSTVSRLHISYDQAFGCCTVTHRETELPPQPNTRESLIKLARRRGVYLRTIPLFTPTLEKDTIRLHEEKIRKFIQEVIQPALRGIQVPIQLELRRRWHHWHIPDNSRIPSILAPIDLLLNIPSVTHLRICWRFDPIDIIRFLSAPQPVRRMDGEPEEGLAWPIPLLETLTVTCSGQDQSVILRTLDELILKRSSWAQHNAGGSGVAAHLGHADTLESGRDNSQPLQGLKQIFVENPQEPPFKTWDIKNGWRDAEVDK